MKKLLTRHGNSYALVIDKPILDLLNIHPDTLLEITTDGKTLTVSPMNGEDRGENIKTQKLTAAKKRILAKYEKTFKKLAE